MASEHSLSGGMLALALACVASAGCDVIGAVDPPTDYQLCLVDGGCADVSLIADGRCGEWESLQARGMAVCGEQDLVIADTTSCSCGTLDLSSDCTSIMLRSEHLELSNAACISEVLISYVEGPRELRISNMPDLERIVFVPLAGNRVPGFITIEITGNPRLSEVVGEVRVFREMTVQDNPRLEWDVLTQTWCANCSCGNAGQPPC